MSTTLKPITLYGQGGPNPPKVAIILAELSIPHTIIPTPLSDVKQPWYVALNPNGRLPTIHDPNTGLTLWESGAIVEYLITTYDKEHKLSFPAGSNEAWHAKQWLFYQTTGQGPYFGQAFWFKKFHAEKIPSAIERYVTEVNRVTGVLEAWLAKQKEEHVDGDGPWLVGNRISYADIAFIPYQKIMELGLAKDEYDVDKFAHVKAWMGRMVEREAVKKVLTEAGAIKH